MKGYLLDSDVIIWCLRGRSATLAFLKNLPPALPRACSAISVLEVMVGAKPKEEDATRALLGGLVQHPVTGEIAEEAARILQSFTARGITLDAFDALIAATARLEDLTLLTYNVRRYPMKDIEVIAP